MPKTLALIAVHKQTAASRSASPWIRVQHGVFGGVPIVMSINPPSKSAHTPNFSVSLGQVALPWLGPAGGEGQSDFGLGGGGVGLGVGQVPHALDRVKKTTFSARKMAIDEEFFVLP
ncbi:amino acid adenylation domain-containing protein [Striga asiatica]|uniref:Amino acid adenylation domain-containing protein n=1 Tax=Striga asiatica TaxID=4170 RepID=A0A5A7P547_STRAF|nr:amino acid adenylation domain-containing protein [Striga asiatica]